MSICCDMRKACLHGAVARRSTGLGPERFKEVPEDLRPFLRHDESARLVCSPNTFRTEDTGSRQDLSSPSKLVTLTMSTSTNRSCSEEAKLSGMYIVFLVYQSYIYTGSLPCLLASVLVCASHRSSWPTTWATATWDVSVVKYSPPI